MLVCYGIDLKRFQNVEFEGTELLIDEPMVRVRLALGAEKEIKKANDFYEKNIKDHPNDKELKKLHINSKELKIIAQKNFTDGLNKYLKQLKKIRGKTVVNLEYKIEQFEYAKEYIKNMKKELENSDFENKVKEIFIKNVKEFEKNINIEYEKNIDLYNRHKSKAPREERIVEIFEEKELNKQKQVLEEFDRNVKLDYAKTVALYGEYKHPNKKLKGIKKILNRLSVRSLFGRRYKKKQPKLSKDELKKLEIKPKNVTKQKEEHKI